MCHYIETLRPRRPNPGRSLQDDVTQRRRVSDPPTQKKSKARDARSRGPMFYSAFDSWRGPSGWTQREYQKDTKKRANGLFSQCRRATAAFKSHGADVARKERSARTWKLLRLTPPTNGFQQLASPLHHLGQTLTFRAKPWNTGEKKEKKQQWIYVSR